MKSKTSKRRYKISYKRFAIFVACIILLCALIVFAVSNFLNDGNAGAAGKSISVTKEMSTMIDTSAAHEQRLQQAIKASPMVRKAVPNIGYKGGKKFLKYCGYSYHADWCACFVSWCAGKNGYISSGKMEKFAYVPYGYYWFKDEKRFKKAGSKPSPGNLIFFDWDGDGTPNHVGIVEYYYKGQVYTVEGNRNNVCTEKHYPVGSKKILGYGTIKE
jgi:CHAP domain.